MVVTALGTLVSLGDDVVCVDQEGSDQPPRHLQRSACFVGRQVDAKSVETVDADVDVAETGAVPVAFVKEFPAQFPGDDVVVVEDFHLDSQRVVRAEAEPDLDVRICFKEGSGYDPGGHSTPPFRAGGYGYVRTWCRTCILYHIML